MYFIYCFGWGEKNNTMRFFIQLNLYIPVIYSFFFFNFISILVSIPDFLECFLALSWYQLANRRFTGGMVLASKNLTKQYCFTFSDFLSSERGVYHLCYRWDWFGSRCLQMQRSGMFPTLTSGVQLAHSQFSFLLSWSEVIVMGVNTLWF